MHVLIMKLLVQDNNLMLTFIMSLYFPPPCPHNNHSNAQLHFLSVQITAARHAVKTDCGVGVTAVGYTGCDILAIVDDPVSKSDSTVS